MASSITCQNLTESCMPCVDIHTHIIPESWPDWNEKFGYSGFITIEKLSNGTALLYQNERPFRRIQSNCWCPNARIQDFGKLGLQKQVLSTVPALGFNYWAPVHDAVQIAQYLNDHILSVLKAYPSQFMGLCTIPMQGPDLALIELKRCLDAGFHGCQIGTNINGKLLSDSSYESFWEEVELLNCPVFIHPWDMPKEDRFQHYWFSWLVGMPCETTLAISSFIFSGLFIRHPKLRICFAHAGGAFVGTLGRIQHGFHARPDLTQIHTVEDPKSQLKYIYVDSLTHDKDMLLLCMKIFGIDHVMVGSDYPFPLGEAIPGGIVRSLTDADLSDIPSARRLSISDVQAAILYKNLDRFFDRTNPL